MAGSEQQKKMMIGVVALIAIVGAGIGLAYYYDLIPSGSKPQGNAAPQITDLPPAQQEEAKKAEAARQADLNNPKKPKGSS